MVFSNSFVVRDPNAVTQINTNVSSNTDFTLADGSDGIFYSVAGCTTPISTVQVVSGGQTATFYYRKTTTTPPAATITVALSTPVSPAITGLTQALTVNLTANQTYTLSGTNGASFYYDSGCTAAASPLTLTILNGTNSISGLYVKTANTGSVTISATGTLTATPLALTYSAPPPTLLALDGPILMNAGSSCGSYTIATQDGAGIDRAVSSNTTITVASTGELRFNSTLMRLVLRPCQATKWSLLQDQAVLAFM